MTMDVSRLGIVVESQGISTAKNELIGGNGRGGLAAAADKTEKAVQKLTDTMSKMMSAVSGANTGALNRALTDVQNTLQTLQGSVKAQSTAFGQMSNSMNRAATAADKLNAAMARMSSGVTAGQALAMNTALGQLQGTMASLAASAQQTTAAVRALGPAINNATQATQRGTAANNAHAASGGVMVNTLKAMATAAAAYISINTITQTIKMADSWQLMQARLQNATGSLNNAVVAQGQMYDLSQRLRTPLEESIRLYTRLAPAVQRMGKDSAYAKDMVEGIATALQLGGATGSETASVMLQLSQSFSSGVLNGAEFNAVAENGSVLMRALERSTGMSTAELKKLGSQGKLSMEVVGKAIQANLPLWREQFDRLPVTFEGAMTRIKNAWTKAIGEVGQQTGFNQRISQALRTVEEMLPGIAKTLGEMFAGVVGWIDKNKEGLIDFGRQIKLTASEIWNISAGFADWVGKVVGATDGLTGFSKVLFAIRIVMAAIADAVSTIGKAVLDVGVFVMEYFVGPFMKAKNLLADINFAMGKFYAIVSKSADALGMDELSKNLANNAMEAFGASAKGREGVKAYYESLLKMKQTIVDIEDSREKEGTYVQQALKNQAELLKNIEAQKQAEAEMARLRALHPQRMDEKAWSDNNPGKKGGKVDQKVLDAINSARNTGLQLEAQVNAALEEQIQLRQRLAQYGLQYEKLGPNQKRVIEFEEKISALQKERGKNDQENAKIKETLRWYTMLLDKVKQAADVELANQRTLDMLRTRKTESDQRESDLKTLRDEVEALQGKVDAYKQLKGSVEDLAIATAQEKLAIAEMYSDGSEGSKTFIDQIKQQIALLERKRDLLNIQGSQEAMDRFDKLFDDRKAERFGQVLAEGFGNAGKALGQMMNAMDKYQARQAKISQGRKELDKMDKNSIEYTKRATKLGEEEAESRIASYADMAGAAKGFFKEGTAGYRALEGAEKAFRVFQMAMQLKAFLQEIGLIQASTVATVTGNATKMASDTAAAATGVASATAQGTAIAAAGVANQAMGDPYTAFPRMAAMAALMVALGFAVNGRGGSSQSASRQAAQGTGTVFGDSKAKSESISKSIEILSKNSDIALRYSSSMLQSLQSIEHSLTGAVSGVIRTGGSVTGKDFSGGFNGGSLAGSALSATLGTGTIGLVANLVGRVIGGSIGKFLQTITGFTSTTSLKDSGLAGKNQSIADILSNGFSVQSYQDVNTKKKAFGFTYSNKTRTNYGAVDPAVGNEFSNVIEGMVSTLTSAAQVLGFSGEEVRKKLEAVNIDIGKISLKDLSTEEIEKQLTAVFSAIGDKLSTVALPSVLAFQKAGEGLLETAVRVASGVESANYELEKLGINAIKYTDIVDKNGDVGAEIVRQSILAVEQSKGITEIIKTLSGDANEIADTYKQLTSVRDALQRLGIAGDVSVDLIRAAGGLEAMQDSLEAYTKNFFTDSEQNAFKLSALQKEFAKLGLSMPKTKAEFRALVDQLSASGLTGQELALKVIGLSEAFADLSDSTDGLIADARSALKDAYDAEAESLQSVIDKMSEFSDSLKDFKKGLLTGDLSTLDVAGKYSVEKASYESVLAKALTGDSDAIAKYQDAAQSFLEASRAMNASGPAYTADFEKVLMQIDLVQKIADGQKSDAQKQLDALNKQVQGLIDINTSVLTVAQAIANLTALMAGGVTAGTKVDDSKATIQPVEAPSVTTQAVSNTTSSDNAALLAQVAALTAEVQGLRAEQAQQAAMQQATTLAAADANAAQISDSFYDATSQAAWSGKVQNQIN